ncbi:oxidoreductase FAD-binding domain protein, partial [Yersinia pestis PY-66]
MLDTQTI